jgi:hypothetical protein
MIDQDRFDDMVSAVSELRKQVIELKEESQLIHHLKGEIEDLKTQISDLKQALANGTLSKIGRLDDEIDNGSIKDSINPSTPGHELCKNLKMRSNVFRCQNNQLRAFEFINQLIEVTKYQSV